LVLSADHPSRDIFPLFYDQAALSEKRRKQRISLPKGMFVVWYGGGESTVSRVLTLGAGGLFISSPKSPPEGTKLTLVFEVPGGTVHADAIVRNVTPGEGMGVEFSKVGPKSRILMERLLKSLLR
jgi:hypothetical protein